MLKELGAELRGVREDQGMSLEAVAGPAKISAAYLHKLEHGSVHSPSPRVLCRLAATLGLPYLRLMEKAGYLDGQQAAEARKRKPPPHPHPLEGQELTQEEWRAVGAFIQTLIAQRGLK